MTFRWDGNVGSNITGTVYTTCTGNLSFTDDNVRAVYIDWDDGTDPTGSLSNKKEYANYQWVELTKPTGALDVEHTYTGTGTWAPVIQVLNSTGIVSNYYGSDATNTDVSPYNQAVSPTAHQTFETLDGTAAGIMNVENKRVLSGIDNSLLNAEGPKTLYIVVPPLVSGADLANIGDITLEVTAVVDASLISSAASKAALGGAGQTVQTLSQTITSTNVTGGTGVTEFTGSSSVAGLISQVLKVQWKNPKYSGSSRADNYSVNASYNYVKIFLVAKSTADDTTGYFYPITYVSAGSPIKSVEDPTRYISMDFSQSRAKASNVTNLQYRYDVGKSWFNPAFRWNVVSGAHTSTLSKFFGNNTVLSGSSSKQVSFAFNNVRPDGLNGSGTIGAATTPSIAFTDDTDADWVLNDDQIYRTNQFTVDDYGRFTDQYHLVRESMQPSSQTVYPPTTVALEYTSSISANKPYVFRITPAVATGNILSTAKVDFNVGTDGVFTADYTAAAFANGSANMVNLSGMNSASFEDIAGNTRNANEYLLVLFSSKTNKLFFNINNYAKNLVRSNLSGASFTDGWSVAGVSYLAMDASGTINQNAYWKNVPFEDTTKISMEYKDDTNKKYVEQSNSLSQSGYISFDMPLDWKATSITNLCGGQFDTVTQTFDTTRDLLITGSCVAASYTPDGTFGNYLTFTETGSSGDKLADYFNTPADVGAFKYIAMVADTGSSAANSENRILWVAGEDGDNAWDGTTGLDLLYGEDTTSYTPSNLISSDDEIQLLIRRINIYDIMTGVSKVYKGSTAVLLPPVDATSGSNFPQSYFLSGGGAGTLSSVGTALQDAWGTTDLYALKISLSGTAAHVSAFPEIWNIFDATESHVEIVTESDDSAYNLNSVAVTSDIQIIRQGTYYQAITKKGKVFISRTGDSIQTIGFQSVALGNSSDTALPWDYDKSPSQPKSLYGHLHMMRKIQQNNVRVYWDEVQKDGTYVRFWGMVTNLTETHQQGGPNTVKRYSFTMTVEQIALIDANSKLMTDIFPLGGIQSATTYS